MSGSVTVNQVKGRTRRGAVAAALDPGLLPIDERGLPELLAMAPALARQFAFIGEDGELAGDWQPFFERDVLSLAAEIATNGSDGQASAHDAAELEARLRCGTEAETRQREHEIVCHLLLIAAKFDRWYRRARQIDFGRPEYRAGALTLALEKSIRRELVPALFALGEQLLPPARLGDFDRLWRQEFDDRRKEQEQEQQREQGRQPPQQATPDDSHGPLPGALHRLQDALVRIGRSAAAELDLALARDDDHPPHIGLYAAFLQLQQLLQADLNGFTARHLDYYYRDVLQLAPRPALADTTLVAFELVTNALPRSLPKGTLLSAGKDSAGNAILYATEDDLEVGHAAVASIKTLFVERAQYAGGAITQVDARPQADSEDGHGQPLRSPAAGWPTFGRGGAAAGEQRQAGFGLLVGSPVLGLSEGERRVRVSFDIGPASLDKAHAALRDAVARYDGGQLTPRQALEQGCLLYVSGDQEWRQVAVFSFSRSEEEACMVLDFVLDAAAPACVPNRQPDTPACGWPMLKLAFAPEAPVFLYTFFATLKIGAIRLDVDVSGMTGLELDGAGGIYTRGTPFAPFGTIPECGAGMRINHPELRRKAVSRVTVNIAWQDMLQGAPGIAQYYRGYPMAFGDGAFTLGAEVCAGRSWLALDGGTARPLFAGGYRAGRFSFELPPLDEATGGGDPIARAAAAARGTLRLWLASPSYGFGHRQYPAIFADHALANAQALIGKKALRPTINPPLAPVFTSVSLDYTAADLCPADPMPGAAPIGRQARCFYLTPFGYSSDLDDLAVLLRPGEDYSGHLYLGLQPGAAGTALSLYFEMRERDIPELVSCPPYSEADDGADSGAEAVSWRFLSHNRWSALPPAVVSSGTHGFSRSGIVQFQLPPDIDIIGNTLMPAGLVWLEARVRGGPGLDCSTVRIVPHAVSARRHGAAPAGADVPVLAPNSIVGLSTKVPAIARVSQPYRSSGGRALETDLACRERISQRLRHKGRANQPGDYERLVLEMFPELFQAKCSTANNCAGYPGWSGVAPGEIVVTVAARTLEPFAGYQLRQFGAALRALGSPLVGQVTVRNVLIEPVKVLASVRLKPGERSDAALHQLGQAIRRCIAPWEADGERPIEIGSGALHGYRLVEAIRTLGCVAGLDALALQHTSCDQVVHWVKEGGSMVPSRPWAVLMPAATHAIELGAAHPRGIGWMTIGTDYHVAAPAPEGTP